VKKFIILAAILASVGTASASDLRDVVHFAAGVNGAWFDGNSAAFPSDFEAGGNVAASLSPHLAWVGATYYGFDHSYFRWSTGGRVTVTDVDNKNFSVGLGMQYHGASEAELRPSEWAPDASFGWVIMPDQLPNLLVVGQGSYGLESNQARAIVGLRYKIKL